MGLDVTVGFLVDLAEHDPEALDALRADFAAANHALAKAGLPEHNEPERADWQPLSLEMYGYSGLHYLRRVAAHLWAGHDVPAPGTDETIESDPELRRYYDTDGRRGGGLLGRLSRGPDAAPSFDHLILHSDAEGFYLPIAFPDVIRSPDVVGGYLGSSQSLRDELLVLADALALPSDTDPESDEVWEASETQGEGDGWGRYGVESFTCIRLLHAAYASVERGAAIVFH